MEYSNLPIEDEDKDTFTTVMTNNTILDCRIAKLKSYISNLKSELKDISRQIEKEKVINDRYRSEIEIKQSCELQARNRIQNLNESKKLIIKLFNDLSEQVNVQKRRINEKKKFQDNTIKSLHVKWEEYEKIYSTLAVVKEVENEELKLKALQIEKMCKEKELNEMKEKWKTKLIIQERVVQILEENLNKTKMNNAELVKKKEELKNKCLMQVKLIDSLRQEKNELLSEINKKAGSILSKYMKRPGELIMSGHCDTLQANFEASNGSDSLSDDLPELPRLQLPQTTTPVRKIRRIDMVDTTLVRPDFINFSKMGSLSQPFNKQNEIERNGFALRKITTSSNTHKVNFLNQHEKENSNPKYNNVNKNINRVTSINQENSFSCHTVTNQLIIVKPIVNDQNKKSSENFEDNVDPKNSDNNLNIRSSQNEECEDAGNYEFNKGSGRNNEGEDFAVNHGSCSDNINDKLDDGYYSQSITSQNLSLASQNCTTVSPSKQIIQPQQKVSTNKRTESQKQNLSNQMGGLNLAQAQEGTNEGNTRNSRTIAPSPTIVSTSIQESDQTQSDYFMSRQNDSHGQLLPPPPPTCSQSGGSAFKTPLMPPSRNNNWTSTITSQSLPSVSNSSGFFDNSTSFKPTNFNAGQNQQKQTDNIQEEPNLIQSHEGFMSPNSPWMKNSCPPHHNMDLGSPPEDISFNDSYLNLLSPPTGQQVRGEPGLSGQTPVALPKSINMFGGPSMTQETSSGFSFTSKLPTPSSLFSMFK